MPCRCESSLCDHAGSCTRSSDERLVMDYVVHTCTQCASNMCATDGAQHIHLVKQD